MEITPERLIEAGFKKAGNAWYGRTGINVTNWGEKWQLWINGACKEVATMEEIKRN